MLLHELVHAADPGSRIAYQPVFINYINDCKESLTVLPSKFAFLNLNEALACFYADGSNGSAYSLPGATIKQLQKPTTRELAWNKHYRNGCRLRKENQVRALQEFRTSFSIENNCPMSLFMQGRCYYDLKDYQKSAKSLQDADKLFEQLGVPDSEPTRILLRYLLARAFAELHKWNRAKPLFNSLFAQTQNIDISNAAKNWLKYCNDMERYERSN